MNSIKCPSCGLVNFADAKTCKRCKKPLAAAPSSSSSTVSPWQERSPAEPTAEKLSKDSETKQVLKFIPFVIFGVPLALALKDQIFGPPAKPGGHVESLQMYVIVGCTIALIITTIVILLTRKK